MGKKAVWLQDIVFFIAELYFLIPTIRSDHSRSGYKKFICKKRKDKSSFNINTCVQQEKISTAGVVLGAAFIR